MINERKILLWSLEALIIVCLLWVGSQLTFILAPVFTFISAVFIPLVVSIFLYYMMRPLMGLLLKVKIRGHQIPRSILSLLIVILLLLAVVGVLLALIQPVINEFNELLKWLPQATKQGQALVNEISHYDWVRQIDLSSYYDQISDNLTDFLKRTVDVLSTSAGSLIGTIANIVVVVVTVPVMLFYMLKDSPKFTPSIQRFFSERHAKEVGGLLRQMNQTLSSYIAGQALECLFVALGTTIGYLIIGQPLAIVLGIVAGITNMVPYIGPYIGITPALLIALAISPAQALGVIIVVVIVQQIDGNIIYPNIIGKSLQIHPLTIIVLLLAAGNLAGIGGMILCVPVYAVCRTVLGYFWNIYRLEKEK